MAKRKHREAIAGHDYQVLPNGSLLVQRHFANLLEPYKEEQIPDILGAVDHSLRLDKKAYEKALYRNELEYNALMRLLEQAHLRLVFAFQGWNGAGKSGAITRLVEATGHDPRILKWIPIGPPNDEDKKHDHLWRFNKYDRMPAEGQASAFDRSWWERLMIEKVMSFTSPKEIEKSYEELRSWEQGLVSRGYIVVNLWMDITVAGSKQDEQWKRFCARKRTNPWKLTKADMEEREHVKEYQAAINEMFYRTGTQYAPWNVISSEDKKYSRVTVLDVANQAIIERLVKEVGERQLVKMVVDLLSQVVEFRGRKLLKIMRRLLGRIMDETKLNENVTEEKLRELLGKKLLRRALGGKTMSEVLEEEERRKQEKQQRKEKKEKEKRKANEKSRVRDVLADKLVRDILGGKKPRKILSELKRLKKEAKKLARAEAAKPDAAVEESKGEGESKE